MNKIILKKRNRSLMPFFKNTTVFGSKLVLLLMLVQFSFNTMAQTDCDSGTLLGATDVCTNQSSTYQIISSTEDWDLVNITGVANTDWTWNTSGTTVTWKRAGTYVLTFSDVGGTNITCSSREYTISVINNTAVSSVQGGGVCIGEAVPQVRAIGVAGRIDKWQRRYENGQWEDINETDAELPIEYVYTQPGRSEYKVFVSSTCGSVTKTGVVSISGPASPTLSASVSQCGFESGYSPISAVSQAPAPPIWHVYYDQFMQEITTIQATQSGTSFSSS
ncbi:MAG: hypothetical protein AAFX87_30440, partial [Bacteroidota bacterium]